MTQANLFDDVAALGNEFLSLSRSHQVLQKYVWQLGAICDLIKHTHSIVVDNLDAIEVAMSLQEASVLVAKLEDAPLTASFRANGLCDIFEGFGVALRRVVGTTLHPDGSIETLPISDERKQLWLHFCESLENREREVASLYAHEIQEIGDLVAQTSTTHDLDALKAAARKARTILTRQMANFDSLASQFRQHLGAQR